MKTLSQQKAITPTADQQNKQGSSQDVVYLGNLTPISTKVGFGSFGVGKIPFDSPEDNVTVGSSLTFWGGSTSYDKGLFAHSPSRIGYRLDGKYSKLLTSYFFQKGCDSLDGVIFRILADGKEVYNSGIFGLSKPLTKKKS